VFDYTYDNVGNRKTMKVDSSNTHRYTYDGIYRITRADYPSVADANYYYDPVGNRRKVEKNGTTNYTANNLNEYTAVGGASYSYDNNGNLKNDGTYKYYYDCENRLIDVNDQSNNHKASYEYDYLGRRVKKTVYPSGGWISPAGYSDPENCWSGDLNAYDCNFTTCAYVGWFGYQLGAESGPLILTHAGVNCSKIRYKAGTFNAYIQIWVYYNDDWHIVHDGYVPEPPSEPHYIELGGTYWVTGIKFVVVCDTDEGSYGEVSEAQFCESQGGDYKRYVYDGDQIIAEYDNSGTLLRKYVYGSGIDEPVCMIAAGGTKYYYHFDGLGSVIALSNTSGGIVERYSYDVFGEPNRVSAVGNPYMFTGRVYDPNTGLYDYRARVYKPQIGRFLQTDPIQASLNLYTYCENNPVNWIDPWGLDTYKQRRALGGDSTRWIIDPIAHEFSFTRNPDGTVKDTYSWGNTFDDRRNGIWHKNMPEDRKAAKEGLRNGTAVRVGDDSLDPYVEKAYQNKVTNDKPHNWWLWNNCQTENQDLLNNAKKKKGSE